MRKTTPVEEFNIKEIKQNLEKKQDEMILENLKQKREKIIRKIWYLSLNEIANNNRPYLVDFEFIMNRIINDVKVDQDIESIQVKLDITEQLEKMKVLPSLKTECYIEGKKLGKCTNITSFIRKFIFRQKKYRIIFHNKEARFSQQYYRINNLLFIGILCFMCIIFIFSLISENFFLIDFSLISMISVSYIWAICLL